MQQNKEPYVADVRTDRPVIGMIGSGSWATAMIKILSDNILEKSICWWVRNEETATHIRDFGHNPNYLSAVKLEIPSSQINTDIREIVRTSDILILNTPAAFLKSALEETDKDSFKDKIIVSAIKGIVPQDNLVVGEFLNTQLGIPSSNIVAVGGPCHAEEVAQERLSYLTIASEAKETASKIAELLHGRYINTIVSDDIYGLEYGAVLKNIYAVACGICHGVGYGDNFQAVLVSNAIREIDLFVSTVYPLKRNIMESAYLGDLLVTSYSQFSRNRTFGNMIGKGYSVGAAQLEMNMIAEGYYASGCIQQMCQKSNVALPICDAVFNILYKGVHPGQEMSKLSGLLN